MEVLVTEVGKGWVGLGYKPRNEEFQVRCIFDIPISHSNGNIKYVVEYMESETEKVSRSIFKAMRLQER